MITPSTLSDLWQRLKTRWRGSHEPSGTPGCVLVTGATSFIGRALVSALTARGIPVRVLVHLAPRPGSLPWPNVQVTYADLASPGAEFIRKTAEGCDVVFHLAAFSDESIPQRLYMVNVRGTKALVEAARYAGVQRFILISTLATVGRVWNDSTEPSAWQQQATHHVRSRFLAEEVALIARRKGLAVTVVNLPTVVAPRMPLDHPFVEWLTCESLAWCALPDTAPIHLVTLRDTADFLVELATEGTCYSRLVPLAPDELTSQDLIRIWEAVGVSPTLPPPVQFAWRDHPPLYYRLTGASEVPVIRLATPARPALRSLLRHVVKVRRANPYVFHAPA